MNLFNIFHLGRKEESYQRDFREKFHNTNSRYSSSGIGNGKHRVKRQTQLIKRLLDSHGAPRGDL